MADMLLDSRGLIQVIAGNIQIDTSIDSIQKWSIDGNNYLIGNYTLVENVDAPIEIIPEKYFYIGGEFVLNPNYINEGEELQALRTENRKLKEQVEAHELDQAETELIIDERLCNLELGLA